MRQNKLYSLRRLIFVLVASGISITLLPGFPSLNEVIPAQVVKKQPTNKKDIPSEKPPANPAPTNSNSDQPSSSPTTAKENNVTYLDDLKDVSFSSGYGILGKHGQTGYQRADVQRVRLKSDPAKELAHSLTIHPKGTISIKLKQTGDPIAHVAYELGKRYRIFRGTAAMNFPTKEDGMEHALTSRWEGKAGTPIKFRVLGDSKLLWESRPLQTHGDSQECEVVIEGIDKLRLEVTCEGAENFAWSFWANPRVLNSNVPADSDTANPNSDPPAPNSKSAKDTNVMYLDDLVETTFSSGYGTLGKHGQTGYQRADVQRVRLKSDPAKEMAHSLSMVPKGTISKQLKQTGDPIAHVAYELGKRYRVFRGTAAMNFPTTEDGMEHALTSRWEGKAGTSIKFRVLGDSKLLWESRPLQTHGDSQECEVEIEGIDKLRLEVTCEGAERFAWSFWANPRVSNEKALNATSSGEADVGQLVRGTAEIKLADKVTDAVFGGGGQYWCLLLSKSKQIVVFDVNKIETPRYISLVTGNAKIAAGRDKLLVAYPESNEIQRYDLETFELEIREKLPFTGNLNQICLGSESTRLMLVGYARAVTFLDIKTLKEVSLKNHLLPEVFHVSDHNRHPTHIRSSPDGKLYGAWTTKLSSTGLNSIVVFESGTRSYYRHGSFGNVVPTGNGRIFTAAGIFTSELDPFETSGEFDWKRHLISSHQGDWFLGITPLTFAYTQVLHKKPLPPGVTIYDGECHAVGSLDDIGMKLGDDDNADNDFTQDKRVLFSPFNELIAWIAPSNDILHLYKFDLTVLLEMTGKNYLIVTSRPPRVNPGELYRYAITVKSKHGGVKFNLDDGPKGMMIDKDGVVTWEVPADWAGGNSIISVSDQSDQEIFHVVQLDLN